MMVGERRSLRAWEAHLEEVIGVDDAAAIVDTLDRSVGEEYLDRALAQQSAQLKTEITAEVTAQVTERVTERVTEQVTERVTAQLSGQLMAAWRRDLLLVSVGQFFALAGAVAALVSLT